MKSKDEVDALEKLIGQLHGLHTEMSQLARKSPNDGLNLFKLKLVNSVLASANLLLVGAYKPFDDFLEFDTDALPTNSDITVILSQYIEQTERLRSDNVIYDKHRWKYLINDQPSEVESRAPTRLGGERK